MMKFVLKFIKKRDLYGKGITFNINGRETINSLCGGTFSIIYFIFFLIILITNFQTFLRKDPIVTLSSAFRDITEAYDNLTQPEINFSFFLMNFKSIPPKPITVFPYNLSKLSNKLVYVNNTETNDPTLKLGNMIYCEESELYMQDELFQGPYNIAKNKAGGKNFSLCFEVNKEDGYFTVGGDTETRNTTYIHSFRIFWDLCQLVDKPRGCSLTDAEYTRLNALSLIILLKNSYADYKLKSGISKFYEGKKYMLDLASDYSVKIYPRRLKISTDRNLIYNIVENEENKDYVQEIVGSATPKISKTNEFMVSLDFLLSNYIDTVERRYIKVDDVLANVGSIVGIVEIILIYIAGFFTEGNMEHSIYKEIFHIQKKQNHKIPEFLNIDYDKFVIKKINKTDENKVFLFINNSKHKNNSGRSANEIEGNSNLENFEVGNFTDPKNDNYSATSKISPLYLNNYIVEETKKNKKNFKDSSDRSSHISQDKLQGDIDLKDFKTVNGEELEVSNLVIENDLNNTSTKNQKSEKDRDKNGELENITFSTANPKQINLHLNNYFNNKIISNDVKLDKKVYDDFRKILKEKTIKKSHAVKFYQIFSCLIKNNKNMRLLINMQDFISEELDIVKILKKLIEYENFKTLVLTQNQIKIFNIMQKRILTEEILEEDASDFYKDFYFKNKMKELKNFKYLVDHLFDFDEENKYSKIIIQRLKDCYNLSKNNV